MVQFRSQAAVRPWVSYFTSLNLGFLMGIMTSTYLEAVSGELVTKHKGLYKAGTEVGCSFSPVPAARLAGLASLLNPGVEWLDSRPEPGAKAGAVSGGSYCPCHWVSWLLLSGPGMSQDRATGRTPQAKRVPSGTEPCPWNLAPPSSSGTLSL